MQGHSDLRVSDREELFKVAAILIRYKNLHAVIRRREDLAKKTPCMHLSEKQFSALDLLFGKCQEMSELVVNAVFHPCLDDALLGADPKFLPKLLARLNFPHLKIALDNEFVSNDRFQAIIKLPDQRFAEISTLLSVNIISQSLIGGYFTVDKLLNINQRQYARFMNPDIQLSCANKSLCVEEVLRVDSLETMPNITDYLEMKAEKEKLYGEIGLSLTELQKAKLCNYDLLFIRKSFGPAHHRAVNNLHDVLALTDEESGMLNHIIPAYRDLFFFTDYKIPISKIFGFTRQEKKFIDNALLIDDKALLMEMWRGNFYRIYNDKHHDLLSSESRRDSSIDEVSPLVPFEDRVGALIASLLNKLQAYIDKIEEHRNPNNLLYPDFAFGFRFFVCWQAVNRRANYFLATELHGKLSEDNPDIVNLFLNETLRALRFKEGKPSPNHGIRSDDMNEIINEARHFIARHGKALKKRRVVAPIIV